MRVSRTVPFSTWPFLICLASTGLCAPSVYPQPQQPPSQTTISPAPSTASSTADAANPDNWPEERRLAMLDQVIANQKKNDEGDSVYEHIEKKEIHKGAATTAPEIHVTRNIPA